MLFKGKGNEVDLYLRDIYYLLYPYDDFIVYRRNSYKLLYNLYNSRSMLKGLMKARRFFQAAFEN